MEIVHQLALFIANKPGKIAAVCQVLADQSINILALATSDTVDHMVVRMVVDRPQEALKFFEAQGTLAVANEVLMFEDENKIGSLLHIASVLAKNNINIEYMYCAAHPTAKRGLVIMRTSNLAKSMRVLNTSKVAF